LSSISHFSTSIENQIQNQEKEQTLKDAEKRKLFIIYDALLSEKRIKICGKNSILYDTMKSNKTYLKLDER
jgi:hypothetical protein